MNYFYHTRMIIHLTEEICKGIFLDDEAQSIIGQGNEIKNSKPRKEDIVQEA